MVIKDKFLIFLIIVVQLHSIQSLRPGQKPKPVYTEESCGEQLISRGFVYNYYAQSSVVRRGEFPWNAVIMRKRVLRNTEKWRYLCGGTLINADTVLTGATCIHQKGRRYATEAENLKVILGAYNISDPTERHRKEFEVFGILVHGEWNPEDYEKYAHDIALLKLKSAIEKFSPMIRPICLKKSDTLSAIKNGTVVGYGEFNETRGITSDVQRKVELPIVDLKYAIKEETRLVSVAWNKSFFAHYRYGGVCPGDSGAGFYVKSDGIFYLRGLVSAAVHGADYNCTHNSIAIYTNVMEYLDDFVLPFASLERSQWVHLSRSHCIKPDDK